MQINDRAFVVHTRAFKDSSLIIDCLTEQHGLVSLLAKGAKKLRSRFAGFLQPFVVLDLTWVGRSELKTLTQVEASCLIPQLVGSQIMLGMYLNELIVRLVHKMDPHPEIFELYHQTLVSLRQQNTGAHHENCLRQFELQLVASLGYGLTQSQELVPDLLYTYDTGVGIIEREGGQQGESISGQTLMDLFEKNPLNAHQLKEAKLFMRDVLRHHLGDKPLQSRQLFRARNQRCPSEE